MVISNQLHCIISKFILPSQSILLKQTAFNFFRCSMKYQFPVALANVLTMILFNCIDLTHKVILS